METVIDELTKMLIEQDLKEKKQNKVEYIKMPKTEFIKHHIKLLKFIKNTFCIK